MMDFTDHDRKLLVATLIGRLLLYVGYKELSRAISGGRRGSSTACKSVGNDCGQDDLLTLLKHPADRFKYLKRCVIS
jgi:hypothetical protein